jgi:hypothetical protein
MGLRETSMNRSVSILVFAVWFQGCPLVSQPVGTQPTSQAVTSDQNSSAAAGPRAVKIIFRTGSAGSFDAYSGSGTVPGQGLGHRATRLFYPDNTLMAEGTYNTSQWPKWINFVELGISGPNNTVSGGTRKSTNSDCARFANSNESNVACDFNQDLTQDNTTELCGAPASYYRVSEFDCADSNNTSIGDGRETDPIYLRVQLSREPSKLAAHENVLAVIEYSAAGIHGPPTQIAQCYSGGAFEPDHPNCSDQTWKAYLRPSGTLATAPNPFLMLIPPVSSFLVSQQSSSSTVVTRQLGNLIQTRQILLPLAATPNWDTLQISRIRATTNFTTPWNTTNPVCVTNSALCVGVVFYSLTLYRI